MFSSSSSSSSCESLRLIRLIPQTDIPIPRVQKPITKSKRIRRHNNNKQHSSKSAISSTTDQPTLKKKNSDASDLDFLWTKHDASLFKSTQNFMMAGPQDKARLVYIINYKHCQWVQCISDVLQQSHFYHELSFNVTTSIFVMHFTSCHCLGTLLFALRDINDVVLHLRA